MQIIPPRVSEPLKNTSPLRTVTTDRCIGRFRVIDRPRARAQLTSARNEAAAPRRYTLFFPLHFGRPSCRRIFQIFSAPLHPRISLSLSPPSLPLLYRPFAGSKQQAAGTCRKPRVGEEGREFPETQGRKKKKKKQEYRSHPRAN